MMYATKFHRRCGDRVTLLNHNTTAIRNFVEFNHGLILGAEPLSDDAMFEVKIDRKVNVWNGSLEIGVTTLDPEFMELPATATKLRNTAWILSGNSIVKDGVTLVNVYGPELDSLREGDRVGVTRTSKGELMFFINGRSLGVAAKDLPPRLFPVIDLYGQCVQVSIMHNNYPRPAIESTHEVEECPEEENERLQQAEAAAWSADSKGARDTYIQMPIACPLVSQDHLRFHPRCGILVKLSFNNKTAERARPLDDYNNGVVMTHRPLYDNELFEIRIDRLVDKWSGSIEVGVTTHNPATIRFPSTMTNMDSGTIMMSGCKVLLNGHGTCMEYGNFNLDELREGDTVGMMRKSNGKLHYFINGIDQGVATDKVASQVWGVIDLYGMTVKVTIVDPCEDLDSNINHLPLRQISAPQLPVPTTSSYRPGLDEEMLLFHTLRDSNVIIINDGKTAHRPNAFEFFNNGIVMTNRTLKTNELFQVRLDLVIPKWAGSIEIGVTQHSSKDIKFPFKMSNATSGTWAVTGEDVVRDGTIIIPQYVRHLNQLVEGDTVGVMRKDMGILHFYVNGMDQGPAAFNIPEHVFGIVDLYGRVAQATIVDMYMPPPSTSPESPISSESNTTVFPEMCFHRVHGRNARLSRNRLTASRATVYSEFNDAVLFSSRPLRECDMFELRIEKMVDCWIGSLEIGVTAIRPDDLEASGGVGAIAGTATDLSWDTYILSGAAMMKDGECVRSGYPLDLDTLTEGSRVGIMWHADRSLHYYLDGMDMGKAWYVPHLNIYAVVDLYGQCAQVSIVQNGDRNYNYNGYNTENFVKRPHRGVVSPPPPYWTFSEYCGDNIVLRYNYNFAQRMNPDPLGAIVFSSHHLAIDDIYEIQIHECKFIYAGSFRMGVTDVNILNANVNRHFPLTIQWLPHFTAYIDGRYLKYSQPGSREQKIQSFVPSFEWLRPGDRVGFKKTSDSRVLIYYNSELLDLAFEKVPDKVYVVCELGGHVTMIKAVVRGKPAVPFQLTVKNDNVTMPPIPMTTSDANATDNATGESMISVSAATIAAAAVVTTDSLTTISTDTMVEVTEDPTSNIPEPSQTIPSHTKILGKRMLIDLSSMWVLRPPTLPIIPDPKIRQPATLPAIPVAGPSGGFGLEKLFEEPVEQNTNIYLPSAPTMAVIESPSTPEPTVETEPQPTEDITYDAYAGEVGEAAAAVLIEDNAIAGPSREIEISPSRVIEIGPSPEIEIEPSRETEIGPSREIEIGPSREIEIGPSREIEIGLSREIEIVNQVSPAELRRSFRPLPYTFHYVHGRNIRLTSSDTVARRIRGHAEGVAIASQPLRRGTHFRFRVDKVANEWQGTACIGAVAALPNLVPPRSALHFDVPAWVVTSDALLNKGRCYRSDVGRNLDEITENSVLTLHFKYNSELLLDIDNTILGVIAIIPRMFTRIFPTIDLYGKIIQVSILLHPYVIGGGTSLDLPVIEEIYRECSQEVPDDEGYGGDDDDDDDSPENVGSGKRDNQRQRLLNEWRNRKQANKSSRQNNDQENDGNSPGPSRRPDNLPGLPNANDAQNHQIKCNQIVLPERKSLHLSLMLPNGPDVNVSDNDEAANQILGMRRSMSTEQFSRPADNSAGETSSDDENSLINALSLGSRLLDDDDSLDVPEICDTNIRHNDRYPEATCHDADLLDNEIVDAMTLDAGNLPDLTEEQSPSIDESTRRDDFWSDGMMHIENLTYLNNILHYSPEEGRPRFAERDWVFYSESNGNCEHMHLALKYWNYLVLPYPDMREVVASGQVRCFCINCQPDADPAYAGWVRIERANASGSGHMFWHLLRATLVSASALSGETSGPMRRPPVLVALPNTNPTAADIWFDEEGKPHHTVIAIDIDTSAGSDPTDDRLIAYMIYLRPNINFNEDNAVDRDPNSFED